MTASEPILATITGKDLLDKLDGVTQAVTDLALKISPLPAAVADHEGRLRRLEYRQWFAAGVAACVASGTTGAILSVMGH